MRRQTVSRERLLSAAAELSRARGLPGVSIRAVAERCGVSVGSIYNYFPAKDDLLCAVIEDFWRRSAHRETSAPLPGERFPDYVGRLYGALRRDLDAFQAQWLSQISELDARAREKGRALEARCFSHLKKALASALEGDSQVRGTGTAADGAAFIDFVFSNMLLELRSGARDCRYFQQILRALLYDAPDARQGRSGAFP